MSAALQALGLQPFFSQQTSLEEIEARRVARVTEVQRTLTSVFDGVDALSLPLVPTLRDALPEARPTVGDWVVLSDDRSHIARVLQRNSLFRRVAAGEKSIVQPIAANIDILFIVTSCNEDFNESRLERYLAMAAEARVMPVVVLSKIDLTDLLNDFIERARQVQRDLAIEAINGLDAATFDGVRAWIQPGTTTALVGSSGVGKSTLLNTLSGSGKAATAGIREADQKGRHTTSHRALYPLPNGGLIIDVPGIRELKVAAIDTAIGSVFDDIEGLALNCRFADCQHAAEPGCAVIAALDAGDLTARRLSNYRKLIRENKRHTATVAEARSTGKALARLVREAKASKSNKSNDR